jgi:hydroxyacylglutathione hydrolase
MFRRFFDDGLAQASFLIASERTREAAIVDPRRDVDVYVDAARQQGLTIVYAIETHVHADFVSGSRELTAAGARVVGGPGSALKYPAHEACDGEEIALGDVVLKVMHTPGHTPEHISIFVKAPGEPQRVLTGDTLFVGAVGRPDLLGQDLTRRLAGELYDSLFQKLLALPEDVEVHPGHGAGSLCGAGIGKDPHSTIGQERRFNPMLQHRTRDAFVSAVLGDLPGTPPYFARMKRVNQHGPDVLGLMKGVPEPRPLTADAASRAVREGATLLDLRPASAFGEGHPAGALNLAFGSKVGYWAGWVVPADARVVLLSDALAPVLDVTRQLLRVGLDAIEGYVDGGFRAWRAAGLPTAVIEAAGVSGLLDRIARDRLQLVDVRTPREFEAGHIDGALNIPVGDLPARIGEVAGFKRLAVICEGGYRSSLAASLLAARGRDVVNVDGGMAAFRSVEAAS